MLGCQGLSGRGGEGLQQRPLGLQRRHSTGSHPPRTGKAVEPTHPVPALAAARASWSPSLHPERPGRGPHARTRRLLQGLRGPARSCSGVSSPARLPRKSVFRLQVSLALFHGLAPVCWLRSGPAHPPEGQPADALGIRAEVRRGPWDLND